MSQEAPAAQVAKAVANAAHTKTVIVKESEVLLLQLRDDVAALATRVTALEQLRVCTCPPVEAAASCTEAAEASPPVSARIADSLKELADALASGKPLDEVFRCCTVACTPARAEESAQAQEIEQLRVQLAACLTAAEGATHQPAVQGDYGWSRAYQTVLDLRKAYDGVCLGRLAADDTVSANSWEMLYAMIRKLHARNAKDKDGRCAQTFPVQYWTMRLREHVGNIWLGLLQQSTPPAREADISTQTDLFGKTAVAYCWTVAMCGLQLRDLPKVVAPVKDAWALSDVTEQLLAETERLYGALHRCAPDTALPAGTPRLLGEIWSLYELLRVALHIPLPKAMHAATAALEEQFGR
jgi:hypothetical protein